MIRKAIAVFIGLILTCLPFYLLPMIAQASPTPTFYVDPSNVVDQNLTPGSSFAVNVNVSDAVDLFCWQVSMIWDAGEINVIGFVYGDFLAGQPQGTVNASHLENGQGWLLLGQTTHGAYPGVDGDGWLCSVIFSVEALGETVIDISSGYDVFQTYYIDSQMSIIGDQAGELVKQNGYFSNLGGGEVDTTPPVANAGPDQTIYEDAGMVTFDGSSSSDNVGIVSYVWTFTDVTPQILTGVNPTYTFTTMGVYTVTLTVTDAAGNWATDTVIISVLALIPEPLIQGLIETIQTWRLPGGTGNSLTSKLEEALHLLEIGNENGATHNLMDFISQVKALKGSKLTSDQANYLLNQAQKIIDRIKE